jgi:glycosyltransferase involved in cell wall biosynthesis
MSSMKKILIISGDTVDNNMGGVGVRNWELARSIAEHCQVTLAIPNESDLSSPNLNLIAYRLEGGDLRSAAEGMDAIITHGFVLHFHPYLSELGIPLAIDLYVPSLLESLVWHDQDNWETWIPQYEEYLRVQSELLRKGDFFFCASERQRDYWLGWLHAQKRINPHTYHLDPSLRRLIDVVPFGLPDEQPISTQPVLKGVHPGIAADDQVILWSGGLWDWLDPLTLIRAVAELAPRFPRLKLYFMGTRHPNPVVSGMTMPDKAIALSRELGLFESRIFFGDWVPYQDRVNYLMEADFAVVSHPGHIETHFSFRTRALDCIWAGIPLVVTEGDAVADWVEKENLGLIAPTGDAGALAAAIEKILSAGGKKAYEKSFDKLRQSLRWNRVVQPLLQFCVQPNLSPDKGQYLTEAERLTRDKDAFLQQVIRDKDDFLEKVVRDKDAEINRLVEQNTRLKQFLPIRILLSIRRLFKPT